MTDVHTPEQRRRNMAAIRGKHTKPEMRVRSLLHSLGYRFRLHRNDPPGKPDIVLPKYKLAIFVNGCFWHCHTCKYGRVVPVTRAEFWAAKREGNVERDRRKNRELKLAGWKSATIWECSTKEPERLLSAVKAIFRRIR